MSVVLLKEAMNTRYIINSLNGAFRNICNSCEEQGDTLDLADCKFGPECASILRDYCGKFEIINSTDTKLNEILANNAMVVGQATIAYEPFSIDRNVTIDWVIARIQDLPQGAQYTVNISLTETKCKAALVLLIMARPDIEWDIRQCASDVYDFVRESWLVNAESHDCYYELVAPHTISRKVNNPSERLFGAVDYGFMSEREFVSRRTVLPYEFGNSQIVRLGEKILEEWRSTAEKCINVFDNASTEKRIRGNTTRNFLTFRGDYVDD